MTSRARSTSAISEGCRWSGGGTTASGVLLRSANLQGLTAADISRLLDELRVRVVVDLRTGEESALEGDGPLVRDGRIELRHRSLYPEKGKLTDVMISRADGEMPAVRYYLRYLRDRPDSIVGALDDIAAADGAVLVHCAAGKDRTGVVVALALAAVGCGARGDRRRLRPHRRADRRDHGPAARVGDLPRRPRALHRRVAQAAGRDHRARVRGARRASTAARSAGCEQGFDPARLRARLAAY